MLQFSSVCALQMKSFYVYARRPCWLQARFVPLVLHLRRTNKQLYSQDQCSFRFLKDLSTLGPERFTELPGANGRISSI